MNEPRKVYTFEPSGYGYTAGDPYGSYSGRLSGPKRENETWRPFKLVPAEASPPAPELDAIKAAWEDYQQRVYGSVVEPVPPEDFIVGYRAARPAPSDEGLRAAAKRVIETHWDSPERQRAVRDLAAALEIARVVLATPTSGK